MSASFVAFPTADLEQSIATRFEAQALRHGARVAVQGERRTLTYDELNELAGRIAGTVLDRCGGEPGPVALLLEHDVLMPAAILGVLKAGCSSVALDPDHPEERNAFILADSGARLLVTDRQHRPAALALAALAGGACAVCEVEQAVRSAATNGSSAASPADPCCIIYTSGSTGRPKGVCLQHRSLLHNALAYTNLARLGCEDRLTLLHSMSGVAGSTALYGALLNGAAILPFSVRRRGLERLAAWLARERVTCLHAVPTLFRRLTQQLAAGSRFDRIRLIRLGGEAVTRTEWLLFREHFAPGCRLLNGLGSTEALSVRQSLFAPDADPGGPVLPVGEPVPDKEVFLLDGNGRPAATGRVGEIFVRGDYLFSGYWRRPDLTRRVLAADQQGGRRRIFRTGDLGRFTEDGRLFHVGRTDSQVKIAGNRIEIAEVEFALREVPLVRDAAVTHRSRGAHDVQLVAFVEAAGAAAPRRHDLRASLRRRLPEQMLPAAFVFVDALPLLPGGKIDRRELAGRAGRLRAAYQPPGNPVEETLVEVWQRALGAADLGVHDDLFLDLGGDSLAAAEILGEVSRIFHRQLPLSALYDAANVSALAARILDAGWRPPTSGLLFVNRDGSCPPLFGICGAFGHAVRLLLVGRALGEDQPFVGLQPPGMDWESSGCRTIGEMAGWYAAEIRRLQPRGPYRLIGTSFGGIIAFEIARQLQSAGAAVALLAMVDTSPPAGAGPGGGDRAPRLDWGAGLTASDPLVGMGLRVARAHRAALDRYALAGRFRGVITFFHCADPPVPATSDRRRLWARFATGGQILIPLPGKHGHFHREPQFSALVAGLRSSLAAAPAPESARNARIS